MRLAPVSAELMVAEGIEDCLSAMQETRRPGWAAGGSWLMSNMALPDAVREVVILADRDAAGEAAAHRSAAKWFAEGRKVRIAWPPPGCKDFNDSLTEKKK